MRLHVTAVDAVSGSRADLRVTAAPGDSVDALAAALASLLPGQGGADCGRNGVSNGDPEGSPPRPGGLWRAGVRLDPAAGIGPAGVRDGDVLALGGPHGTVADDADVPGVAEVRVVGGPDAGLVTRLPYGSAVIGRSADAAVRLSDVDASRRHAVLHVTPESLLLEDLGSTNGTRVEGDPLGAPASVRPGQLLGVGENLLVVTTPQAPDAALAPGPDGSLDYNRPPRLQPAPRAASVELPREPRQAEKKTLPVLAFVLPLVMGAVLFLALKSPIYLLFTLMGPVLLIGNTVTERRGGAKSYRTRKSEYDAALAAAQARLATLLAQETQERRSTCPDAAEVLLTATGPRRRLWERRRSDDDALLLRVGLADAPAQVTVKQAPGAEGDSGPGPSTVRSVPVTVPLGEVGVLGVAGPRQRTRATARWCLAQVAVLHSPRDVGVVLLVDGGTGAEARAEWEWVRWLPHAAPFDGVDALAAVGCDPESIARRVTELAGVVATRTRAAQDVRGSLRVRSEASVVVVLDGARALRALPGMPQVLQGGPAVGIHAICLDTDERFLPEECQAVVTASPTETSRVAVRRAWGETVTDVRADAVSAAWAERVARALAPLRDVSREEGESQIPSSARLLDLLALDPPTAEGVAARWTLGGRSTAALLGVSAEGPLTLDLRRDGPHTLVAGTTGSGKSEFLQSLVAALAVANRPDAMTFVLVDYKGGAAFKDCARLPHTVGMVTDLDGHLVERALQSLSAELKSREQQLGLAGAKDIEDYWQARAGAAVGRAGAAPGLAPLPRLVIVIDEFASLAEELPDFVRGLVGIAQRGRSLGVHLVLATQRPSGVVSPEIRANTNLRVALRVTDSAESSDVVDAPDAARISRATPGRGYVRTGHASLVAFQSARVGGRRPGLVPMTKDDVVVTEVEWDRVGLPVPRAPAPEAPEDDQTDLHALVEAVRDADARLELPRQRSPWLDPLPGLLPLASITGGQQQDATLPGDAPAGGPLPDGTLPPVVFGLEDLPAEQARRAAALDLTHGGHLLVAGAPRSGRSTLLRTVAGSLAATCSPADVHLYALDCGNGALLPLAGLPHCGAVVTRTQLERADRLLTRLSAEVARRQELLAESGYADVAEQRAGAPDPQTRLPFLVLLVDRWEGFVSSFDDIDTGRLTDMFLRLLREGPGAGLRVVVTGDRSLLIGKVASAVEDRLVLRLADRADYSLAGLSVRQLPDAIEPGRAFRAETMGEVQLALLGNDPSGAGQAAELQALFETWAARQALPSYRLPFRVDVMPARVSWREAQERAEGPRPFSPLWAVVGIGGDELTPYAVDLDATGPAFVIGGPARSGRSTTLLSMAHSFLDGGGASLVVLAPRPSPLRGLAGTPGVMRVLTSSDPDPADLASTLNDVVGPLVMLVDDAELLHPSDAQPLLQQVLRDGRDLTHAMVLAGTTEELLAAFRGFTADARKSRNGLLLSPEAHTQGELLGLRLPRSAVFTGPPGRGLLSTGGQLTLVQVPLPP